MTKSPIKRLCPGAFRRCIRFSAVRFIVSTGCPGFPAGSAVRTGHIRRLHVLSQRAGERESHAPARIYLRRSRSTQRANARSKPRRPQRSPAVSSRSRFDHLEYQLPKPHDYQGRAGAVAPCVESSGVRSLSGGVDRAGAQTHSLLPCTPFYRAGSEALDGLAPVVDEHFGGGAPRVHKERG